MNSQQLTGYASIVAGLAIIVLFSFKLLLQIVFLLIGVMLVVTGLQKTRSMGKVYRHVQIFMHQFRK